VLAEQRVKVGGGQRLVLARGCAPVWPGIKRSPAPSSIRRNHDNLTNRPLHELVIVAVGAMPERRLLWISGALDLHWSTRQHNRLILELKAAKALADEHVAQILGYLRSSRVEHGLLINFGAPKFEIKKYVLSRIGEVSRPGGFIGGNLSLFASLAPFRGLFHSGF
jgi:hypothetical protein